MNFINLINQYNDKFISKWLVLTMDIFLVTFAYIIAITIRFNFEFTYTDAHLFKYHVVLVVLVKLIFFLYFQSYIGIIRHTSFEDASKLVKALFYSWGLLLAFSFLGTWTNIAFFDISRSILLIDFFVSVFALVVSRLIIKKLFEVLAQNFKSTKPVIIYGAGRLGLMTKNALQSTSLKQYKVLHFIDDNEQKIGKTIEGINVISKADAFKLLDEKDEDNIEVVFAIQDISLGRKAEIVEEFLEENIAIRTVPPMEKWMNGELNAAQISEISIEDLLERPAIQINNRLVKSSLKSKRILITGAAGSIGSEIVRQVLNYEPAKVVLLDQAESALYDLETELFRLNEEVSYVSETYLEVGSITDLVFMDRIFAKYKPQVVFHAAAYKHVPLMEDNPYKAIEVNSFGTQGLADLSAKYDVEKFVFVSTDKAVNPTNVMGATKRLAEIYVQSLNSNPKINTRFITTRFGNVLGSNGSVIPIFKRQIESGGPVTVTDENIIRYFMTIPEACQLVLEAGTMGKGGEIFVFDMGVPVKILDLAVKMIRLSGFEPYTEIPIKFSGLRPGEKLYEELLSDEESTIPTHHPKIMIAKVKSYEYDEVKVLMGQTKKDLPTLKSIEVVKFLKLMIPEFISKNSPYESLDSVSK